MEGHLRWNYKMSWGEFDVPWRGGVISGCLNNFWNKFWGQNVFPELPPGVSLKAYFWWASCRSPNVWGTAFCPFKHSFRQQIMGETVCACVCLSLCKAGLKRRTDLLRVCSFSENISKITDVLGMCVLSFTWCVLVCDWAHSLTAFNKASFRLLCVLLLCRGADEQ